MKLKLNKKKMKTLSADSSNIPADMTPQIAGGTQINSSYVTYRDCPPPRTISGGAVSLCQAHTCGMGHTCQDVY